MWNPNIPHFVWNAAADALRDGATSPRRPSHPPFFLSAAVSKCHPLMRIHGARVHGQEDSKRHVIGSDSGLRTTRGAVSPAHWMFSGALMAE